MNQRRRTLIWAAASIVGIWLVVVAGYFYFEHLKVTAEKVQAYVESTDFARLTGDARAKALRKLEDDLNALSYEERQKLRGDHVINSWFAEMTEDEKTQFVEATLPSGFKQMISAFEQLPEENRRRAIDNAMRNLRTANARPQSSTNSVNAGTNVPPAISPELETKIRTIGLNSFYSQSSAQTKAELAPLLEELQRQMESGRAFHRHQ